MAKKILKVIGLQIPAGKASPGVPIGPALGSVGANIMEFCKAFNAKTQERSGDLIPVEISVYSDRSFSFVLKQSPAANLIMKELGISKGSRIPNREKVGQLTHQQLQKIARVKSPDLRSSCEERRMRIIAGTARSMGVDIVDEHE